MHTYILHFARTGRTEHVAYASTAQRSMLLLLKQCSIPAPGCLWLVAG
jgi:hypothetical protein